MTLHLYQTAAREAGMTEWANMSILLDKPASRRMEVVMSEIVEPDLAELEADIAALRADEARRREQAQKLLVEAGERETAAQKFLDENTSLLPYRVAACAVGDETFTPEAVAAFRRELETARHAVEEMQLLQQGLSELLRADWTSNARLTKALHKRDAARRRQKLLAEGRLIS